MFLHGVMKMRKSKHVLYRQEKAKERKNWLKIIERRFGKEHVIKAKHIVILTSRVRLSRRIARWKAYILNCGHRNYLDWER